MIDACARFIANAQDCIAKGSFWDVLRCRTGRLQCACTDVHVQLHTECRQTHLFALHLLFYTSDYERMP